jgi:hypothetical protein
VGKATLTAYIAICAFTLIICISILFASVFVSHAKKIPATTSFPMWDAYANCEIDDAGLMAKPQHYGLPKRLAGKDMINTISKMRIKLVDGDRRTLGAV